MKHRDNVKTLRCKQRDTSRFGPGTLYITLHKTVVSCMDTREHKSFRDTRRKDRNVRLAQMLRGKQQHGRKMCAHKGSTEENLFI